VAALLVTSALAAVMATRTWRGATDPAPITANAAARPAFELGVYLRGRFLASYADLDLLTRARDAFAESARLDPAFAGAAAEQADTLVEMSFAGAIRFRDGLVQARGAAKRALAVDQSQPVAARVLGMAALFLDWDFDAARGWLDRAAAVSSDARTSLARATWLAAAGRFDAAVEAAERGVALDPAAFYVRADLAMFYLAAGRNAEAAATSHRVLDVAPDFAPARAYALLADERLGRWTDAAFQARTLMRSTGAAAADVARIDRLEGAAAVAFWRHWDLAQLERQASGRRADFALHLALRHAVQGDRHAALDELEQALSRRNPLLACVRAFPEFTALRGDPRFEAVARAVSF
jgi:tetratricopeptide (TPR) repeat protein